MPSDNLALSFPMVAQDAARLLLAAQPADEPGGAPAIEVAALLGDSVIGVKHCIDPRGGKVTRATWVLAAAAIACLIASAIAFAASVRTAVDNVHRRDLWVIAHRPERAFRPVVVGAGVAWIAFGGLALGIVGATAALVRMRGERVSPHYRIGTAPGVELAIAGAPLPAFPLIAPSGDDFVFNYAQGIDGELIVDGVITPLAALAAAGRSRPSTALPDAFELAIPPRGRIRARSGQIAFVISRVARPGRVATPLGAAIESRAAIYVAGSLVLHLAAWGFLQALPPDAATVSVVPLAAEPLGIRAAVVARSDAFREPIEDRGDSGGAQAQSMALASGASGDPEVDRGAGRLRAQRLDERPRLSRADAVRIALRQGVLGSDLLVSGIEALSATDDLTSAFEGESANGPIDGPGGAGRGTFGTGISGIEGVCADVGCDGTMTGAYATIPGGKHAGGDYRLPFGRGPHGGGHETIVPHLGDPQVGPTYDKTIIRRYIRRRIEQIAYCYEKQLLAHPGLDGEIMASFLISPAGVVQSSAAKGFDSEIASCIAAVIQAIEFPPPGDAGSVQVNYPFRFHAPAM